MSVPIPEVSPSSKLLYIVSMAWSEPQFVCSYGLERRFRRELFLDFEDLALAQYQSGDLYGVEKYAAFWHYGGNKVVPSELKTNTEVRYMLTRSGDI